mmetsp:Transcript_20195/g.29974  ORF Transcript_20195/g.29974 Transcript_20195/m.29974 type:complete len:173 (-) Transcript_20195:2368-2886(-)
MFDSVDLNSLIPRLSSKDETAQEEEEDWLPSLSWKERMIGCGSCMVLGYILSFGAFFRVKDLLLGNPLPFVLNATIGNMIALAGSCFLSGPKAQAGRMFNETRRAASIAYLVSLGFTLVVAYAPIPGPKGLLLLILMVVQYLSVFWYCLSYIPYAREAVKGYCCRMINDTDV